jgi:hypothetical protein
MSTDKSQNDHSNISDQQSPHVHQSINTNVPSAIDNGNNTHTNTDFHQPASSIGTTGQSEDCNNHQTIQKNLVLNSPSKENQMENSTALTSTGMDIDSDGTPPFNQTAHAAEITRTDSLGQQSTINVQNEQHIGNNDDVSTSFQGNGFISEAQSPKQEQEKSMTNDNNILPLDTDDIRLSVNDQNQTTSNHQLNSQQDVQPMDTDQKDQSNPSAAYSVDQKNKSTDLEKNPIHTDKISFSNCLHYFLSFKIFSLIITTYQLYFFDIFFFILADISKVIDPTSKVQAPSDLTSTVTASNNTTSPLTASGDQTNSPITPGGQTNPLITPGGQTNSPITPGDQTNSSITLCGLSTPSPTLVDPDPRCQFRAGQ